MATTVTHQIHADHTKLIASLVVVVMAASALIGVWQLIDHDSDASSSSTTAPQRSLVDESGLGDALSVTYDAPVVARYVDQIGLGEALSVDPGRRVGNDPMGLGAVFGVQIPYADQ